VTRIAILLALVSLSLSGTEGRETLTPTRLPMLWVHAASADERADAGKPNWMGAFELATPNLDMREREELAELLEDERSHLETKLNPFVSDLLEVDPRSALSRWARSHGPLLQAALALSTSIVALDDGDVATLVERCGPGSCIPVAGEPLEDAGMRHARFAAWPYAAGVVVQVNDANERACTRRALRALAREAKLVSLVVAGDEPAPTTDVERARVGDVLALEAASKASEGGDATGLPPDPPPFSLATTDLLVVPRLAALTAWAEFRDAVVAAVAACTRDTRAVRAPATFP
jgi:hypothetical protein